MNKRTEQLIKDLKIKVKKGNHCSAEPHNNEIILSKKASDYDVLHEISHLICGWGCCREHCEWEAHGGAKVLSKLFGVNKKVVESTEKRMDCYAHRTNPICCGRFKNEDSWLEEVKREERKKVFGFEDFVECRESGRFLINDYWLEYILNLWHQGYLGEIWEEVVETQIDLCERIENLAYGLIAKNTDKTQSPPTQTSNSTSLTSAKQKGFNMGLEVPPTAHPNFFLRR